LIDWRLAESGGLVLGEGTWLVYRLIKFLIEKKGG
jgi:hypothetical protein